MGKKVKRILIVEEEIEIEGDDTPENEAKWVIDFPVDFIDSTKVVLTSKVVDCNTGEVLAEDNG